MPFQLSPSHPPVTSQQPPAPWSHGWLLITQPGYCLQDLQHPVSLDLFNTTPLGLLSEVARHSAPALTVPQHHHEAEFHLALCLLKAATLLMLQIQSPRLCLPRCFYLLVALGWQRCRLQFVGFLQSSRTISFINSQQRPGQCCCGGAQGTPANLVNKDSCCPPRSISSH